MSSIDIQTIIALSILTGALVYAFIRFRNNWRRGDQDPKCDNCEIKDRAQSLKLKDKS